MEKELIKDWPSRCLSCKYCDIKIICQNKKSESYQEYVLDKLKCELWRYKF